MKSKLSILLGLSLLAQVSLSGADEAKKPAADAAKVAFRKSIFNTQLGPMISSIMRHIKTTSLSARLELIGLALILIHSREKLVVVSWVHHEISASYGIVHE